ncbi:sperm-egg fusion protein Juno [Erinaceus europaeus]|uniref:Sperm-egg fusion protein Juno n=1 Tax=Erinaceus europaeus TaxID=9365 RepID=A0A1S3AF88_ERIEU|nr:sperm-egg fusion protein Juno [Erinaceus europaeus]
MAAIAWWLLLVMPVGAEPLGVCMRSAHHKPKPSPEDQLYEECAPWKANACCTANTSWLAHLDVSPLLGASLSHCGLLAPDCRRHFTRALCFLHCSPNLGPWIRPEPGALQARRAAGVPLCKEDCEQWWEDCRSASTCKDDWLHGWHRSGGRTRCPPGASCRPFPRVFPGPAALCGRLWGGTFRASGEPRGSGRCLQTWFPPGTDPNSAVARGCPCPSPAAPLLALPLPLLLPWLS